MGLSARFTTRNRESPVESVWVALPHLHPLGMALTLGIGRTGIDDASRYSNCGGSSRDIFEHDRISSYLCASANVYTSKHFRASTNVNAITEARCSRNTPPTPDGDLLKQETISPDLGLGMHHNSVWMWKDKSAAQAAV